MNKEFLAKLDILLTGKIPQKIDLTKITDEDCHKVADKLNQLFECIEEIQGFILPLSRGVLQDIKIRPQNFLGSPFKELHSTLLHLTWQAKQVARGDYNQRVDFMGDFSDAFNAMVVALDEHEKLLKNKIEELAKEVTERKKAEEELKSAYEQLKITQTQLTQSAKMASVGVLSGGVAHEINNPLTGVLNNVQLIRMIAEAKSDFSIDDFKELLTVIEESAIRCKRITQSLLDFSRGSKGTFQALSLNEIVEKTVILLEHDLRLQNISIRKDLQIDLPLVLGDFQLLQQVVIDIISNAKWAIQQKPEKEGIITLRTQYAHEKKSACLSISDTGIGIPEENLEKIFEPFFTTKRVGEGTGLGLSTVYSVINAHQGNIEVESRINQGTTLKISLPVS